MFDFGGKRPDNDDGGGGGGDATLIGGLSYAAEDPFGEEEEAERTMEIT